MLDWIADWIAGLDCWIGLLDWINGTNQSDDVCSKMWLRRNKGALSHLGSMQDCVVQTFVYRLAEPWKSRDYGTSADSFGKKSVSPCHFDSKVLKLEPIYPICVKGCQKIWDAKSLEDIQY